MVCDNEKEREIEEIICEVLMNHGFDDNYIKYSSYKYKLFAHCVSNLDDYKSICDDMDIYFDKKEEEVLFKILKIYGYDTKSYEQYYFVEQNRKNG